MVRALTYKWCNCDQLFASFPTNSIWYAFTIRLPALAKRHAATAIYYFAIERRRASGMFSLPAANDDRSRLLISSNDLTWVDSYFFRLWRYENKTAIDLTRKRMFWHSRWLLHRLVMKRLSLFLGLDLIVDCRADGCSTGGGEGGAVRLRERPYTYNLSDDRARAGQGDLHVTQPSRGTR